MTVTDKVIEAMHTTSAIILYQVFVKLKLGLIVYTEPLGHETHFRIIYLYF